MRTFFQKSSDAITKSTDAIVETAKALVAGSVAYYEERWIATQEAIVRAESVYDENPSAENHAALRSARAVLKDLEDPLNSARRREVKKNENVKMGQRKAQLKRKAEAIKAVHEAVQEFDDVLASHLEPAGKNLMAALAKANAMGDAGMCSGVSTILHSVPWVTNYYLRDFATVKQFIMTDVSTLSRRLSAFPTIDETGEPNGK
jgi:hypothetical protein